MTPSLRAWRLAGRQLAGAAGRRSARGPAVAVSRNAVPRLYGPLRPSPGPHEPETGAVEPELPNAEASDAFREGLHLRGIPLHEVPQDGIHPAEELRVKAHSRGGDVVPQLLRP